MIDLLENRYTALLSIAVLCVIVGLLTGCATGVGGQRAAGGASYSYERSPDGTVKASVATTRDFQEADITVNKDGTLSAKIKGAESGAATYLETINKALDKLP